MFDLGKGSLRPDPASRWQPDGVHGASAVVDPHFVWHDHDYRAPELTEFVIYEVHIGAFTQDGTFESAISELDRLKKLGITAIEIMPVAQFPGPRNWGYDGASPFAVQNSYGGPAGLKRFVNACHQRGMAVILDVVYNHLGPEGNYLRDFGYYFTEQYKTPWGDALNFDGAGSDHVRGFFLANALYWQTEFHIDALRLDAVQAIKDFSVYPFLSELADATQAKAAHLGRQFYLIAEDDLNEPNLVRPRSAGGYGLNAMWSDDFHHSVHTLLTGERDGYYEDFGLLDDLARAYRNGFTYTGQYSRHRDRRRGTSTEGLSARQFVVCAQNHDQAGNRARGDRLTALTDFEGLKLAAGLVLLSPYVPLLFMGEEYGEAAPFLYFVSHGDADLVEAVRAGRRTEFAKFGWQGEIPDPQDEATFQRSKLNTRLATEGRGKILCEFYRKLIRLRTEVGALGRAATFPAELLANEKTMSLTVRRSGPQSEAILIYHLGAERESVQVVLPQGRWSKMVDSAETIWSGPGTMMAEEIESPGEAELVMPPRSFVAFVRQ
jgi:maltooligosyltrehalose trehalohydrolase